MPRVMVRGRGPSFPRKRSSRFGREAPVCMEPSFVFCSDGRVLLLVPQGLSNQDAGKRRKGLTLSRTLI